MFYVCIDPNEYVKEVSDLIRMFSPGVKLKEVYTDVNLSNDDLYIAGGYKYIEDGQIRVSVCLRNADRVITVKYDDTGAERYSSNKNRELKNAIKRCVYLILKDLFQRELDWGILTGIRPTKIVHSMLDLDIDDNTIIKKLYEEYFVSENKARLLLDTANAQRNILIKNNDQKISLYINIPFCTTKCLYCSFPSDTIGACKDMIDDYINSLIYEIDTFLREIREKGITVQNIYIGGGTPTSLPITELDRLLNAVDSILKYNNVEEYTVEGGRPDSMDMDKLSLLRSHGVTRISINPQSMNEKTLLKVGRNHTPEDVVNCFYMAKKLEFNSINMDVIIGLPEENINDVENTIRSVCQLEPDNITIHTLAVKRASRLKENLGDYRFVDQTTVEEMLSVSRNLVIQKGFFPYYLYRQKYMLGNLENVGYTKPYKECIYNIQMMEEKQSIWAFGAGAVSKIYRSELNRIDRVPNVKNIREYINRIDEMIKRKQKALIEC